MANKLFMQLIHKIVTENGAGHKELAEKVAIGEVTEEEQALIILRANVILFNNKVRTLVEKIEAIPA